MAVRCAMAPDTSGQNRAGRYTALGTGVLLVGATAYTGLVDPHRQGSLFPPCPFKLLTGWNCPACGGLRMVHDLLHGDLAAAVVDNVFLLIGLPLLVGWVVLRLRRRRPVFTPVAVTMLAITVLAWTVIRNLPGFPLVPTIITG